ncbi:hypothetical protein M409DRAFT_51649 [Zasmidium cellare ATCC 36951]|uniref:Zn(2)-C6 fungal-type domain-containing protein n=1 Tax=Zasmidium cellare ATCC 36951 TaxID=1080233 RepID=A0A6A6CU13_ZASCE|nr:uncharacterized protein M409DRAFT_51649 [Zasmidium cellare ATCC 36951]KAF2170644.1 hypothetical protein M409DRAFT_51649 [Zasmidium cellare ATCC 36951]
MVGVAGRSKGCATCRRRKVKCDSTHPACGRCSKAGLTCEGYERYAVFLRKDLDGWQKRKPLEETRPRVKTKPLTMSTGEAELECNNRRRIPLLELRSIAIQAVPFMDYFFRDFICSTDPKILKQDYIDPDTWTYGLKYIKGSDSLLHNVLIAVSMVYCGKTRRDRDLLVQGQTWYCRSLCQLSHLLNNDTSSRDDEVLMSTSSFLAEELWMTAPWDSAGKSVRQKVADCGLLLGDILQQVETALGGKGSSSANDTVKLMEECLMLDMRLVILGGEPPGLLTTEPESADILKAQSNEISDCFSIVDIASKLRLGITILGIRLRIHEAIKSLACTIIVPKNMAHRQPSNQQSTNLATSTLDLVEQYLALEIGSIAKGRHVFALERARVFLEQDDEELSRCDKLLRIVHVDDWDNDYKKHVGKAVLAGRHLWKAFRSKMLVRGLSYASASFSTLFRAQPDNSTAIANSVLDQQRPLQPGQKQQPTSDRLATNTHKTTFTSFDIMKLATTLCSLAMGISVAVAGPTPSSTDILSVNTPPDTGTCFAYNSPLNSYNRYEIKVGRPYIRGEGCEPIKDTLIEHIGAVAKWVCTADGGDDSTILTFIAGTGDVDEDNAKVMDTLHVAYPMVAFDGDSCIVKPVKKPLASRSTPDYATCSTDPDFATSKQAYSIILGRPYIEGLGCEPIEATLIEHTGDVVDWHCDDDGHGGTHIAFQSGPSFDWDANMKVLDALHEAYPMVTFDDLCVAVPVKQRSLSERIPLDSGKCFRCNYPHVEEGSYLVDVGRPYNQGAGCDPVKTTLIEHIGRVVEYNCVDDGEGGTTLRFFAGTNATTEHDNIKVFVALEEAYPTVSFQDDQCIVKTV